MRTLNNLADEIDKFAQQLPAINLPVGKRVALAIIQDLIAVTPVDKGIAVSNWQISTSPIIIVLPAYFPGGKGITAAQNRAAAYQVAVERLEAIKDNSPIWIGNAAPHIGRLNEGSSRQAPAGFIERAILIGQLAGQGESLQT